MEKPGAVGEFLTDLISLIAVVGFCFVTLAYLGAL
jgi:hypothetical protein